MSVVMTTQSSDVNMSVDSNGTSPSASLSDLSTGLFIVIYSLIFVFAVVGNLLVILTLVQNKRMRTVTNVFLLNLAISDLFLAVFCMPFTLIPILIRNFVFGESMCISIRYIQGVSVGASCFTLVAISMERYFAICRPLHSRSWQTLSHAYRTICCCWLLSAVVMVPIAIATKHLTIRPGVCACREIWVLQELERSYTVFLDVVLLLVPILLMSGAYARIMVKLCQGIRAMEPDQAVSASEDASPMKLAAKRCYLVTSNGSKSGTKLDSGPSHNFLFSRRPEVDPPSSACGSAESTPRRKADKVRMIRHSNFEKIRLGKIRVIRMLFVLVVEFFVCWTPLYAVQTWKSFHQEGVANSVSGLTWSVFFVLSYCSSCCNPITYCFMNRRFRQSFLTALSCFRCSSKADLSRFTSNSSKQVGMTSRLTLYDRGCESYSSTEKAGAEVQL